MNVGMLYDVSFVWWGWTISVCWMSGVGLGVDMRGWVLGVTGRVVGGARGGVGLAGWVVGVAGWVVGVAGWGGGRAGTGGGRVRPRCTRVERVCRIRHVQNLRTCCLTQCSPRSNQSTVYSPQPLTYTLYISFAAARFKS